MPTRILIAACLVTLAACGGGGGGGAQATSGSTQTVTEYFDVERTHIKAVGPAIVSADGTYAKQGMWTEYHSSGGMHFLRTYAADSWDTAQPWTEFNADGSWRVDSTDR